MEHDELRRSRASEACKILGLDPTRVRSIGFELDAYSVAVWRVEVITSDAEERQLLELLLA